MTAQLFFNLQNGPTLHSEERLVNIVRGRECFVGLFKTFVYDRDNAQHVLSRLYLSTV